MEKTKLTAEQWAAWVLVGDPCGRIPGPLETLALRIARAIIWHEEDVVQKPVTRDYQI